MNIFKRMYLSSRRTINLRKEVGVIVKGYNKYFYGLSGDLNNSELVYTYKISGAPVDKLKKLMNDFGKANILSEMHYWKGQLEIESISFKDNTMTIIKKGKG